MLEIVQHPKKNMFISEQHRNFFTQKMHRMAASKKWKIYFGQKKKITKKNSAHQSQSGSPDDTVSICTVPGLRRVFS